MWATSESSSVSLRITSSTGMLVSVLQVFMLMSLSSSSFLSLSTTWILSFRMYSALRTASSLCLSLSGLLLFSQDDIIYYAMQPTQQPTLAPQPHTHPHLHQQQQQQGLIPHHRIHKQQKSEPTSFYMHRILLIIAVGLVLVVSALRAYLWSRDNYAHTLQRQIQSHRSQLTQVYASHFFRLYNHTTLLQARNFKENDKCQHIDPQWVRDSVIAMKQGKCRETVESLPVQQIMEMRKQIIFQQHNILAQNQTTPSQRPQQQQFIQQQKQGVEYNKQIIRPIAGITAQKIENAKKWKTLVDSRPWEQNELSRMQYQHYEQAYRIGSYSEQLPFCIVVPTYNNEAGGRYRLNLDSIVQQNYSNYHVVIIEDASTDKTPQLIDQHVDKVKREWESRGKTIDIAVIHNQQQQRAMSNLRAAALHHCKPHEIFVVVDGDDQLIGRQILQLFNSQFQATGCWFAYSNFMSFVGSVGFSRPFKPEVVEENRYRQANFVTSHLRAFYTELFQLVKEEDLKDSKGEYLRAANDVAICLPILEMCHTRVTYIPEVTYLYNSDTGLNNHLIRLQQQINNAKAVRKRPKYLPLKQRQFTHALQTQQH